MTRLAVICYLLLLLKTPIEAQIAGGTTAGDETLTAHITVPGPVSEHSTTVTSLLNGEGEENTTMIVTEESAITTTENLLQTSVVSEASLNATVTPESNTDNRRLDINDTPITVFPQVDPEISLSDIHVSESSSIPDSSAITEDSVHLLTTPEENILTTLPSSSSTTDRGSSTVPELVTEASLPESSHAPVTEASLPMASTTLVTEASLPESSHAPVTEASIPMASTALVTEASLPESSHAPVTEVSLPEASPEPLPAEEITSINDSESPTHSPGPPLDITTTSLPDTSPKEIDKPELYTNISTSTLPPVDSTLMPTDGTYTLETSTYAPTTAPHTTSESHLSSPGLSSNPVTSSSQVTVSNAYRCFWEVEANTLLVVAIMTAINVMAVVVTGICVHRVASRRVSWDPPPIHYNQSNRGEQARQGGPLSGLNLASDRDCKADEGGGAPATHIPILITNEDGWCVPYSDPDHKKKGSEATKDTGV
ncbi:uncharacterized protein [Procambarus clarkii]|uniref:uncharacterized protein isoform X1 n=1 Tax=Procambarus clarkii TaxID=6728 RepID=UPI001E67462D|nr:mucin-2-like [Procambarus clarkii]